MVWVKVLIIIILAHSFDLGGTNGAPAASVPLFLGYYEESHYIAPHYQSIVPLCNNAILQFIVDNGGLAVDLGATTVEGKFLYCIAS